MTPPKDYMKSPTLKSWDSKVLSEGQAPSKWMACPDTTLENQTSSSLQLHFAPSFPWWIAMRPMWLLISLPATLLCHWTFEWAIFRSVETLVGRIKKSQKFGQWKQRDLGGRVGYLSPLWTSESVDRVIPDGKEGLPLLPPRRWCLLFDVPHCQEMRREWWFR